MKRGESVGGGGGTTDPKVSSPGGGEGQIKGTCYLMTQAVTRFELTLSRGIGALLHHMYLHCAGIGAFMNH